MTRSKPHRGVKSTSTAGARLTDLEDATLEATATALRCSRSTAVRQAILILSETCLAALADGARVRSVEDLRSFLTEKLKPAN